MEFLIFTVIITLCVIYFRNQKKEKANNSTVISYQAHKEQTFEQNSPWEEQKLKKEESLNKLKMDFQKVENIVDVLTECDKTLDAYLENHFQSKVEIRERFEKLNLSSKVVEKELQIRKELNKVYKDRDNNESKAFAIFLAYQHAKLLLENPEYVRKNFTGLEKLQNNWKSEEYFPALLNLMYAYLKTCGKNDYKEKLLKNIDSTFAAWNKQSLAKIQYEKNLKGFTDTKSYSDEHFTIQAIVNYLYNRYKYNPKYKDELLRWSKKDVEIYEPFLAECFQYDVFNIEELAEINKNTALKRKKVMEVPLEKVKSLKYYHVPRLDSYNILLEIFAKEKDQENLKWIESIGKKIGYAKG